MSKMRSNEGGLLLLVLGSLSLGLLPATAGAHIRLDQPTSRYPVPLVEDSSFLKEGPCGGGEDARTTDSSRVSFFRPGQTITVSWRETIHHASHYRIAFDADGQDDFTDPSSATDIVDPAVLPVLVDGIVDETSDADSYSVQVTLPEVACDNCTLQLIQYMYGRQEPLYYQCADLVLREDGQPPAGQGGTPNATDGADASDQSGDAEASSAGQGSISPAPPRAKEPVGKGCATRPSGSPPWRASLLLVVGIVAAWRIRGRTS